MYSPWAILCTNACTPHSLCSPTAQTYHRQPQQKTNESDLSTCQCACSPVRRCFSFLTPIRYACMQRTSNFPGSLWKNFVHFSTTPKSRFSQLWYRPCMLCCQEEALVCRVRDTHGPPHRNASKSSILLVQPKPCMQSYTQVKFLKRGAGSIARHPRSLSHDISQAVQPCVKRDRRCAQA